MPKKAKTVSPSVDHEHEDQDDLSDGKDRQFVTALARGLTILRCFTRETPALGAAELARMTGLAQPTVWRLCHTLIKEGYLVQTDRGERMRPGIGVLGLGAAALAGKSIAELAFEDMQTIALRHEGAVSLGTRDGLQMVYLQRCQGSRIVLRDLDVGSRVPLASSATGWAYLAGLERANRDVLFAELEIDMGKAWAPLRHKIDVAIRAFEKQGYVVNKGSLHPLINSVAVPVRSDEDGSLLSLSAGGINQQFDNARLARIGQELIGLSRRLASARASQSVA